MSRKPFQKIVKFTQDLIESEADWVEEFCGKHTESPIEKILATAIFMNGRFCQGGSLQLITAPEADLSAWGSIRFEFQKHIGDYRADFLLTMWGGNRPVCLVIECDGHDFHERTKEQAARDRSRDRQMTLSGYKVLRFTGSEIFRDPMKCAEQVFEWVWGELAARDILEGKI